MADLLFMYCLFSFAWWNAAAIQVYNSILTYWPRPTKRCLRVYMNCFLLMKQHINTLMAVSEGPDQTEQIRKMIWAIVARRCHEDIFRHNYLWKCVTHSRMLYPIYRSNSLISNAIRQHLGYPVHPCNLARIITIFVQPIYAKWTLLS